MEIQFNNEALEAISILERAGFEAYIVGGAVRNLLLEKEISDYDITTNASVDDILNVFSEYKPKLYHSKSKCVGIKINFQHIEVCSFKGNTILDDLSWRDFTCNAIAYSPKSGYIDPYCGTNDILAKVLRPVGSLDDTFKNEPIRLLRLIRFEVLYNLLPTDEAVEYVNNNTDLLDNIHPNRVSKEIDPAILAEKPSFYFYKYQNVFCHLIPELGKCVGFDQHTRWHNLTVFDHLMKVLDFTYSNLVLRYAALFHDMLKPKACVMDDEGHGHFPDHWVLGSEYAKEILTKYCYNKTIIKRVSKLVYYHDVRYEDTNEKIIEFITEFGTHDIDLYFELQKADIVGQNPNLIDRIVEKEKMKQHAITILASNEILTFRTLEIKHNDITQYGFNDRVANEILKDILFKVIKHELPNNREKLFEYLESSRKVYGK